MLLHNRHSDCLTTTGTNLVVFFNNFFEFLGFFFISFLELSVKLNLFFDCGKALRLMSPAISGAKFVSAAYLGTAAHRAHLVLQVQPRVCCRYVPSTTELCSCGSEKVKNTIVSRLLQAQELPLLRTMTYAIN